jgi:hypothetical protein
VKFGSFINWNKGYLYNIILKPIAVLNKDELSQLFNLRSQQ